MRMSAGTYLWVSGVRRDKYAHVQLFHPRPDHQVGKKVRALILKDRVAHHQAQVRRRARTWMRPAPPLPRRRLGVAHEKVRRMPLGHLLSRRIGQLGAQPAGHIGVGLFRGWRRRPPVTLRLRRIPLVEQVALADGPGRLQVARESRSVRLRRVAEKCT